MVVPSERLTADAYMVIRTARITRQHNGLTELGRLVKELFPRHGTFVP